MSKRKTQVLSVINYLESNSQSDFGYLNHERRTKRTDEALVKAAAHWAIYCDELLMWVDSRYARHFMDAGKYKIRDFEIALLRYIPILCAELNNVKRVRIVT